VEATLALLVELTGHISKGQQRQDGDRKNGADNKQKGHSLGHFAAQKGPAVIHLTKP